MSTNAHAFLNQIVSVTMDRPLGSAHPKHGWTYPVNYGFVPDTLSPDGEELDAYVLGVDHPLDQFTGRCIAIVHRLNDDDDKLIVVPDGMMLSDEEVRQAVDFQERFFDCECFERLASTKLASWSCVRPILRRPRWGDGPLDKRINSAQSASLHRWEYRRDHEQRMADR